MSKFEQLCSAYKKAQTEFKEFRDNSRDFAVNLWDRMIQYFEIPPSQLSLYKVNEDDEYETVAPPMFNALTLRSDAYWQVGFGITLFETDKNEFPQETIIIDLLLKWENKDLYKIKLSDHDKEFQIDRNNPDDFKNFFDYIYKEIETDYKTGLQTFLDQNKTIRRIGFKPV
ncbi:MAG: hypothetical protein ACI7YS_17525 [Flavobacterium sp.]